MILHGTRLKAAALAVLLTGFTACQDSDDGDDGLALAALAGAAALSLSTASDATSSARLRLTEVGLAGVDFNGASKWVEIRNDTTATVDLSTYWLCARPDYAIISGLTVLSGDTNLAPGEVVVLAYSSLTDGVGDLGLYNDVNFSSSSAIVDFVQYGGSDTQNRESVAVAAGLWETGTFTAAPASGESLLFTGSGTFAAGWTTTTSSSPGG